MKKLPKPLVALFALVVFTGSISGEERAAKKTAVVVRGTVVDEESGKAVEKFKVSVTARWKSLSSTSQKSFGQGKFEWPLTYFEETETYVVRVEADGYLPLDSEPKQGDSIQFDARLKKGKPIAGVVVGADGKPAKDVTVVLLERMSVQVTNGVWEGSNSVTSTRTDAKGRFVLPPREGDVRMVLFGEPGWMEVRRSDLEKDAKIALRAWCRVEGRLMKGNKPWAGQEVRLTPVVPYSRDGRGEFMSRWGFHYKARSDEQGKFSFDRVVDGAAVVNILLNFDDVPQPHYQASHGLPIALLPGEKKIVELGGSGRPIIGHVVVSDEMKAKKLLPVFAELRLESPRPQMDWEKLDIEQQRAARREFEKTPSYQAYAEAAKEFYGPVRWDDGLMRIDDVPAGDYVLNVAVYRPAPNDRSFSRWEASAEMDVKIPPIAGGRSDEPLDVGKIEIKRHHYLEVGEMAPAFDVPGIDGKRIALADHRGKFVLVDFWATWCGPCIVAMESLEKIHEEFGKDDRLVMMSLSTDDRIDAPRKFLASRKVPGLQGFAGRTSGSTAWKDFGVQGIPSIWLIGPDGKILMAKESDGEKVVEAVRKALGK